jgi:hypothetical protein
MGPKQSASIGPDGYARLVLVQAKENILLMLVVGVPPVTKVRGTAGVLRFHDGAWGNFSLT